jgi:hypothetical protein
MSKKILVVLFYVAVPYPGLGACFERSSIQDPSTALFATQPILPVIPHLPTCSPQNYQCAYQPLTWSTLTFFSRTPSSALFIYLIADAPTASRLNYLARATSLCRMHSTNHMSVCFLISLYRFISTVQGHRSHERRRYRGKTVMCFVVYKQ